METYCVSCKKSNENKNSSVTKTKQNKLMLLSNWIVYQIELIFLLELKSSTILMISLK